MRAKSFSLTPLGKARARRDAKGHFAPRPGKKNVAAKNLPAVSFAELLAMVDCSYLSEMDSRLLAMHILRRARKWPSERAENLPPEADFQP